MILLRSLVALVAIATPLAVAQAQDSAGVAALVKNQVTGEIGSTQRTVVRGDKLFRNEKVATGPASQLNVLFVDETSLSLGPNTSIVLDEMVYDPNSGQGKVVLSIPIGVTRFVSGILPKQDYEIRTPTMTVGIRGTMVDFFVRENGNTTALLRSGEMFIRSPGQPATQSTVVSTPGQSVTSTQGGPPGLPGAPPGDAGQAFSQLPGTQLGFSTTTLPPATNTTTNPPVSPRSYRDSLSTIGNTPTPEKMCTSNGSHSCGDGGDGGNYGG
jgi:hypothetical protein